MTVWRVVSVTQSLNQRTVQTLSEQSIIYSHTFHNYIHPTYASTKHQVDS